MVKSQGPSATVGLPETIPFSVLKVMPAGRAGEIEYEAMVPPSDCGVSAKVVSTVPHRYGLMYSKWGGRMSATQGVAALTATQIPMFTVLEPLGPVAVTA